MGRVLFPRVFVNFLMARRTSVGRGSLWAVWRRLQVHKDFSAERLNHFEWGYSISTTYCKELIYIKNIIDHSKKYFCTGESPLPKGIDEHPYCHCWQDIHPSRKSLGPAKTTLHA